MIYSDDFNRPDTTSDLGTIPGTTIPWELFGAWRISGQKPVTTTAHGSRPAAVGNLGGNDSDTTILANGGDAVYARWIDANNWVGARIRRYTETVVVGTLYEWRGDWQGFAPGALAQNGGSSHKHFDLGSTSWSTSNTACPHASSKTHTHTVWDPVMSVTSTHDHGRTECVLTGNTQAQTTTVTRYQVIIERNLAGTITTLATTTVPATTTLRLRAHGSTLQAFVNGSSTASATANTSDHRTATRHGFGRGPSDVSVTALDAVIIDTLNTAPHAPTLLHPVSTSIASNAANRLRWTFSDPDTGDSQSKAEVRYRRADVARDEVQTVTINGAPTGGTFTLTFDGQTTAAIAYNATAAAVQSALEALSNIGVGDVSVAGTYTVTFAGALGDMDVAQMTATSSLTGGTTPSVTVATTTQGVPPTAWTTVAVNGPNGFLDVAAGTFVDGDWEWQARTWDASGLEGPWSASGFYTSATPVTTHAITSPVAGGVVGANEFLVTHTTPAQDAYQYRTVADNAGAPNEATIYYDTGILSFAGDRSKLLPFPVNGRFEHIQLRVQSGGLWSAWTSVRVQVSYTLPAEPFVVIVENSPIGKIAVTAVNPEPEGTEPAAVSNWLWRRQAVRVIDGVPVFEGEGIRIAPRAGETFPPNGTVVDSMVAAGHHYAYRVEVLGNNTTARFSDWTVSTPPIGAVGKGNLLTAADSTFESQTAGTVGTWQVSNGTVRAIPVVDAPHGRFVLEVTATADGDVVLTLPGDLPLVSGQTYTVFANARHMGASRTVSAELPVVDEHDVLITTLGGSVVEESTGGVVTPGVDYILAEAVDDQGNGAATISTGASLSGIEYLTIVPTEGLEAVEFLVDGVNQGRVTQAPFVHALDTATFRNGIHVLSAVVEYYDVDGVYGVQEPNVEITVSNEVAVDPTFRLAKSPTSSGADATNLIVGSTVTGTVHLTILPTSSLVSSVEFRIDGALLGTIDTTSRFVRSWDTTLATDGAHTVSAIVTYAGAQGTSQTLTASVTVSNGTPPPTGGTSTFRTVVGVNTAGGSAVQNVANFEADLRRPAGSIGASVRFLRKASSWTQYNFGVMLDEYAATGRPIGMLIQGYWGQEAYNNRDGYVDDITDSSANKVRIPLVAKTHAGQTSNLGFTRIRQSQLANGNRIDIRNVGTGVMLAGNREITSITRTTTYVEIGYSGTNVTPTTAHGVFLTGVNTMSAMANGEYNTHYTTIANRLMATLGSSPPVSTAVMHECNGDWYGHSAAGSTNRHTAFKNGFQQLVNTMNPILSDNYYWDFNTSTGTKYAAFELLYPGDDYVHHMSQDFYNRGISHNLLGMTRWLNFRDMPNGLEALKTFAVAHGKRITFHEWAVDSDNPRSEPDDEVYMREFSAWLKGLGNRLAGAWYFNINEPTSGGTEGYGTRHTIYPRSSFTVTYSDGSTKTFPFPFPKAAAAYLAAWRL